ncbi:MAG: TlpA family protein disulfide reductase [Anaerolineales bacterium]|nr:TlpA family protein disulfide reductase [Anaerolineales bacterium]
MQQRYKAFLFTIILVSSLFWIRFSVEQPTILKKDNLQTPHKGFSAPDFTLQTLDGMLVTLSEYQGQIVLLNIWASWCGPCQAEMPAMQHIHEKYLDRGVIILAVNATYQDNTDNVNGFVQELGLTFPVLLDINGQVAKLYQLHSLPTSFFIDRNGIIKEVIIGGPMSGALLQSRIESLLME